MIFNKHVVQLIPTSINFDEQIFGQKMPLKVFVRGGVKIENREYWGQYPN